MPETTQITTTTAVRQPRGAVKAEPLAEVSARWERPLGSDPRDPVPTTDPVYAEADVLVPRPDLGEGAHTLVLAGERLPARDELAPPAAPGPAAAAKVLKPTKG